MRKFYACSVCKPGDDYCQENFNRIISNKGFVLHVNTKQKGTFNDVKIDDILLLKYNRMYVAYGRVTEVKITDDEEWNHWAYVEEWIFQDENNKDIGVDRYGVDDNTLGGGKYGTVKTIINEFAFEKIKLINNESALFKLIEKGFKMDKESIKMQEKIELLEYKKQIILQGPPGTGKTRLAKKIAYELTKAHKTLSPFEYIEYFIQNYNQSAQSNKYEEFVSEKLTEFTSEFPKESIINLTLERYCLGRGLDNSFCYWIEKGLKDVGRFSTGLAGTTVYGVYYSKDDSKYISVLEGMAPEEAIVAIREALSDLIVHENYTKARELFRFSFILKILNSYYPDNYFPIVSQKHLLTVANMLRLEVKGINDIEINIKIKDKFGELTRRYRSTISNYNLMGHLYEKFKIKESKIENVITSEIEEIGETQLIQFHPAYSYEDFVRGIVAETNNENQIEYKVINKTLAAFAKKALDNPTANYVLIIDEINRANLPSVLGELIYALEYRYNASIKNEKDAAVESLYALKFDRSDEVGNNTLMLPTNLYIIGTMNTADRSVGHIDYAIKRRFAFVDVLPEIEPVHPLIKDLFIKISGLFVKNFDGTTDINKIEKSDSLAADFRPEDIWIGHSYFICKKQNKSEDEYDDKAKPILNMKLKYEIIPLLKEYIKDGILIETEQVKNVMNELISKDFTK
jgi:5-methylcytosine-specific restriction enzyme B